jgi:prolyl-tRNA synthetase
VKLDARDIAGADKKWEWIKKGAPLLLEIGQRDIDGGKVCVTRRDQLAQGKRFVARDEFVGGAVAELAAIQKNLFDEALAFQKARTVTNIRNIDEFKEYFSKDAESSYTSGAGFVRAKMGIHSLQPAVLRVLDDLGVTIRCVPFDTEITQGTCVLTGTSEETQDVIFARAY